MPLHPSSNNKELYPFIVKARRDYQLSFHNLARIFSVSITTVNRAMRLYIGPGNPKRNRHIKRKLQPRRKKKDAS